MLVVAIFISSLNDFQGAKSMCAFTPLMPNELVPKELRPRELCNTLPARKSLRDCGEL